MRHEVIPKLKDINPDIENRFAQNAMQIRETELILEKEFERMKPLIMNRQPSHWEINNHLLLNTASPEMYLHEILKGYG